MKVTTVHQKWTQMGLNCTKKDFFNPKKPLDSKKARVAGRTF